MRYLAPPGLTGLVAAGVLGVLSKSPVVAVGAGTIIVIAFLYWVTSESIDYLFAKQVDQRFVRASLKRAVAWLDGDEVRWLGRTIHHTVDQTAINRLHMPSLPQLPPLP